MPLPWPTSCGVLPAVVAPQGHAPGLQQNAFGPEEIGDGGGVVGPGAYLVTLRHSDRFLRVEHVEAV